MTNALVTELFRIAATWTADKERQAAMVNAWFAGQAHTIPARRAK
jgi:hypothetical protein